MLAVLQDAVDALLELSPASTRPMLRDLAATEAWFAAEDFRWPFSFASICETLDVAPGRFRAWLGARREERTQAAQRDGSLHAYAAAHAPWLFLETFGKRRRGPSRRSTEVGGPAPVRLGWPRFGDGRGIRVP